MIDHIDKNILRRVQVNGRISATDLAQEVGLTVSPCHRRLRDLEAAGVIRGYHADVDPAAVGLGFEAIVFVSLRQADRASMSAFEERVEAIDHVVAAQRLFGDPDYLLRVVAADLPAYQRIYDEELTGLPAVAKLTSTIVMKNLKASRAIPIF